MRGVNNEINLFGKGSVVESWIKFDINYVSAWTDAGSEGGVLLIILENTSNILIFGDEFGRIIFDKKNSAATPTISEVFSFFY